MTENRTTILFVCTGNICRSPMAAALFRQRLDEDPARRNWRVLSAGTWAAGGRASTDHAIDEMAARGIDLGGHRSRSIDEGLMEEADLVLVMTQNHAEALSVSFPEHADKVHLISQMVGETYDISDPYGGPRREYAQVAEALEKLVDEGYERIVSLAEGERHD